jgi:hypothetical protein
MENILYIVNKKVMEIWKDIKEFEGYQISSLGRLKRLEYTQDAPFLKTSGYRTIRELITKGSVGKNGYMCANLGRYNKRDYIHRLVGKTFISNPNNYPMVLHADNDKTNNCVENLRWGNNSMNIQQAYNDGIMKCSLTKEACSKGGKTQGNVNKINGHWDRIKTQRWHKLGMKKRLES